MEMGKGKKWLGGKREGERATEIKTQEEGGQGKREGNKLAKLEKLRRGEKEGGGRRGRLGHRDMRELRVKQREWRADERGQRRGEQIIEVGREESLEDAD